MPIFPILHVCHKKIFVRGGLKVQPYFKPKFALKAVVLGHLYFLSLDFFNFCYCLPYLHQCKHQICVLLYLLAHSS